MSEQDFQDLIAKYLAGECSGKEEFELRQLVDLDKKYEEQFEAAYATWEAIHRSSETLHPDVDAAWQKVDGQLTATGANVKSMRSAWPRWSRYAAVIVVLVGLAGLLQWGLSDAGPSQYTAIGGTQMHTLPDSSQVWLTEGSTLTYAANKTRDVSLEGSAFFEVARDEKKPFVIKAQETTIEVLGTSFSVANTDSVVEVRVATGKVAFASQNEKVQLPAGYKASFRKADKIIAKSENQDFDFLPGADRRWIFTDTPLSLILAALQQEYNLAIELSDPTIAQCRFNGSFTQDDPTALLEVVALSLGYDLAEDKGVYRLSGAGCQ
ncbi:MAG: FecR family protein [Bacteroidia bacterium]